MNQPKVNPSLNQQRNKKKVRSVNTKDSTHNNKISGSFSLNNNKDS